MFSPELAGFVRMISFLMSDILSLKYTANSSHLAGEDVSSAVLGSGFRRLFIIEKRIIGLFWFAVIRLEK